MCALYVWYWRDSFCSVLFDAVVYVRSVCVIDEGLFLPCTFHAVVYMRFVCVIDEGLFLPCTLHAVVYMRSVCVIDEWLFLLCTFWRCSVCALCCVIGEWLFPHCTFNVVVYVRTACLRTRSMSAIHFLIGDVRNVLFMRWKSEIKFPFIISGYFMAMTPVLISIRRGGGRMYAIGQCAVPVIFLSIPQH